MIECFITLEFYYLRYYMDCIKEKQINHTTKGARRDFLRFLRSYTLISVDLFVFFA